MQKRGLQAVWCLRHVPTSRGSVVGCAWRRRRKHSANVAAHMLEHQSPCSLGWERGCGARSHFDSACPRAWFGSSLPSHGFVSARRVFCPTGASASPGVAGQIAVGPLLCRTPLRCRLSQRLVMMCCTTPRCFGATLVRFGLRVACLFGIRFSWFALAANGASRGEYVLHRPAVIPNWSLFAKGQCDNIRCRQ